MSKDKEDDALLPAHEICRYIEEVRIKEYPPLFYGICLLTLVILAITSPAILLGALASFFGNTPILSCLGTLGLAGLGFLGSYCIIAGVLDPSDHFSARLLASKKWGLVVDRIENDYKDIAGKRWDTTMNALEIVDGLYGTGSGKAILLAEAEKTRLEGVNQALERVGEYTRHYLELLRARVALLLAHEAEGTMGSPEVGELVLDIRRECKMILDATTLISDKQANLIEFADSCTKKLPPSALLPALPFDP